MIDLTDRLIQTPASAPLRAPNGNLKWHPLRRALQVLCGVLLVGLPLTNGLRLDIRRGEFFFGWHRMAAHNLLLLFWIALLGAWCLVTVSFLYGRLWCGWVCPQTLASDFADSLRRRLDRALHARPGAPSFWVSRSCWSLLLLAAALGTGLTLACYWLAPRTVLLAARHPLADLPAALTVYGLAAVVWADMLWVRRRFCSHACPYGALMSVLADRNTLAVRYLDERDGECIRCGKCVTDCPMGIDIKQGVGQLSCIGCGECIDSCNTVLGRRGQPGLIELRYGLEPERRTRDLTPSRRWGLWDARRGAVVATLFLFLAVVLWNLCGRTPLQASVLANGAIERGTASVRNTYTLVLVNGTPDRQRYTVSVSGLPQGQVTAGAVAAVDARAERMATVTVAGPTALLRPESRTPIVLQVRAGRDQAAVRTIFWTPAGP